MWKTQGNQAQTGKISKWKQKLVNQPEGEAAAPRKAGQSGQTIENMVFSLQYHNNDYSEEEILFNQALNYRYKTSSGEYQEMPLKEGDFIEISFASLTQANAQVNNQMMMNQSQQSIQVNHPHSSSNLNPNAINNQMGNQIFKRIIFKLTKDSFKAQKNDQNQACKMRIIQENNEINELGASQNQAKLEHSMNQKISSIDEFEYLPQLPLESYIVERVEISLRDQYVSRRDMWYILNSLDGKTLYKYKNFEYCGIRFRVRGLFNKEGQEILNGVIKTTQSKFQFLTRSCQIYILVELSEDMYSFDENGFINYEKCLQFIKSYFERCQKISATHEITIVIFSRLFYPQVTNQEELRFHLSEYYKSEEMLTDDQIDELGAFQISKHTKIFQDVFMKVGLFELGRNNWDKILGNLQRYFHYYPSMINWKKDCPQHVKDLMQEVNENHYLIECKLGNAEKMNILEAINLALFNLNNEEEDQNLKTTGQQLMIITGGTGQYRVNADIVEPTKSRVLLGGVPIQIISLNKKPAYKTPLLINCCTYKNPFKTKTQGVLIKNGFAGGHQIIESPTSIGSKQFIEKLNGSFQESPQTQSKQNNNYPAYFFPYWIDIVYLYSTKLFETHFQCLANPFNAIYKVQKLTSNIKFKPHSNYQFLNDINKMEQKLIEKLQKSNQGHHQLDYSKVKNAIKEEAQTNEDEMNEDLKEIQSKVITINQDEYILKQATFIKERGQDLSRYFDDQELNEQLDQFRFSSIETVNQYDAISYGQKSNDLDDITEEEQSNIQGFSMNINQSLSDRKLFDDLLPRRDQTEGNQSNQLAAIRDSNGLNNFSNESKGSGRNILIQGSKDLRFTQVPVLMSPRGTHIPQNHHLSYESVDKSMTNDLKFNPFLLKQEDESHNVQAKAKRNYQQVQGFKNMKQSQNIQQIQSNLSKESANKNRWKHYPKVQQYNFYSDFNDKDVDTLVKMGQIQQLEHIMDGFWKNICECKLLPLTTDFFPHESQLRNKNKYHYELSQASVVSRKGGLIQNFEQYFTEYICLRLTQNFQLINNESLCYVDFKKLWNSDVKMGICSKYDVLKQPQDQNYMMNTYTKMDREDTNAIKSADFKYLLFNYHTSKFQVKISQESRLFNFKSLANLGEVLNDFKNALSVCIKMPQQHFVIFHMNNNNSWQGGQQLSMRQMMKNQAQSLNAQNSNQSPNMGSFNQSSMVGSSFQLFQGGKFDTNMTLPTLQNEGSMSLVRLESMQQDDLIKSVQPSDYNQRFNEVEDQQYNEEIEKEHFLNLKNQLFDLLTKNKNSKFNNYHNMNSINLIEIQKGNLKGENKSHKHATTAYIEDESNTKVVGAYFLQHDTKYQLESCFHLVSLILYFKVICRLFLGYLQAGHKYLKGQIISKGKQKPATSKQFLFQVSSTRSNSILLKLLLYSRKAKKLRVL
ncbi:UNKNOWN [Stylonychia lemnae]|uniref:Vacuolar membrane-associated protein Iml1 N-terminal domain-containing protein n=1 Tax=Stylonychia lemnae TaxID=5949 RepID=A0A077ZQS2_STYLE|nr:UNKNOWN [Stylonychia lemnae]|eukprot:CDW71794.1 UNKNOWN [Stylonychia lemnae]